MNMKNVLLALIIGAALAANAELILFDNTGSPGTGDNLDGLSSVPTTINVPEISGLEMTITAILGSDTGAELNSTATSLGINSDNDSDTDAFESALGQGFTFRFNQDVSITQLDFTNFESGETISFAGSTIAYGDLSNGTTDVYDFSTPLEISANTGITLLATSGTIGIEAMTASVVPEPATMAMLAIGGVLSIVIRRVKRA
jgi:hypothetical protein